MLTSLIDTCKPSAAKSHFYMDFFTWKNCDKVDISLCSSHKYCIKFNNKLIAAKAQIILWLNLADFI